MVGIPALASGCGNAINGANTGREGEGFMDYMKLGNTGMDVSRICLGCMSFGTAEGWIHNE